jgi:hypothetical protein
MSGSLSPDQIDWIDRARDASILEVALRAPVSAKLKKHSREHVGPCPACGGEDRFAVNPKKKGGIFNCRSFGGGNVITMVMHVCSVRFLEACEIINGEPMPAVGSLISPEDTRQAAEEREQLRQERELASEKQENEFRERARGVSFDIWKRAEEISSSPVEEYLRLRGILELPLGLRLRCVRDLPYWIERAGRQTVIHRGPAMVAPILRPDGRFGGLHRTWIDLSQPKGKARIADPDDSSKLCDVKKFLGSTKAGYIELIPVKDPRALIIGEGIEKVLAVWLALHRVGRDLSQTAFRTSLSLGNLGGPHTETVRHSTEKTEKGQAKRVPGPTPQLTEPGIPIPDSIERIIILGDSTSDHLTTRCAIARAETRWRKPGRVIQVAWSPDGIDYDDLLRAA